MAGGSGVAAGAGGDNGGPATAVPSGSSGTALAVAGWRHASSAVTSSSPLAPTLRLGDNRARRTSRIDSMTAPPTARATMAIHDDPVPRAGSFRAPDERGLPVERDETRLAVVSAPTVGFDSSG